MRLLAGTSGFSYREWVGEFYPAKTQAKRMLAYYASRLPAVEINNTFYRMPTRALLEGWRSQVAEDFRFAVKAPRRVSHIKRLRDCAVEMRTLLEGLAVLEPCLGSVLVQLPPFFKVDVAALAEFAAEVPAGCRVAFEFRNASWLIDDVLGVLRERNFALVQSESEEGFEPLPWTADWAYLRLRKVTYSDAELHMWFARLREAGVTEAQVFFKHEDAATGPKLAQRLLDLARAA